MYIEVIGTQIGILAILVFVGVLAARSGIITREGKDALGLIIFNCTLPLLIITNFARMELSADLLRSGSVLMISTAVAQALMYAAGIILSRLFHWPGEERRIFIIHSIFGNIVFLGFPLMTALFGEEGLVFASLYHLISNILMWTLGVYLFSRGNGNIRKGNLKKLLNPNTIAIMVGIVFLLFHIRIPAFLDKPLSGLGGTTIYLSMLYIGALLQQTRFKGLLGRLSIYVLSFSKMLLVPAVMMLLFGFFFRYTGIPVSDTAFSVLILQSATPCMANIVIMAKAFGADDRLATGNVFVSTILSLLTIPLMYYFLRLFL